MSTKARVPAKDFTTLTLRAAGNSAPSGIWSDGATMWVSDSSGDKIYAYDGRASINPTSLSSLLTNLAERAEAVDLVVSMSASKTTVAPSEMITLRATVRNTGGSSAASSTLRWYLSTDSTIDTNTDTEIRTSVLSSLATGTNLTFSNTITVPSNTGTYYYGACVDPVMGEHYTNDNCSSALRVVVILGTRLPTSDFNTPRSVGNNTPTDLWSDGTTMWSLDATLRRIYAYSVSTKAWDRAKDLDANLFRNTGILQPVGIWSDGTTMWVADSDDDKIYAYSLASKARVSAKEFNTLSGAGNHSSGGLWSDGHHHVGRG